MYSASTTNENWFQECKARLNSVSSGDEWEYRIWSGIGKLLLPGYSHVWALCPNSWPRLNKEHPGMCPVCVSLARWNRFVVFFFLKTKSEAPKINWLHWVHRKVLSKSPTVSFVSPIECHCINMKRFETIFPFVFALHIYIPFPCHFIREFQGVVLTSTPLADVARNSSIEH